MIFIHLLRRSVSLCSRVFRIEKSTKKEMTIFQAMQKRHRHQKDSTAIGIRLCSFIKNQAENFRTNAITNKNLFPSASGCLLLMNCLFSEKYSSGVLGLEVGIPGRNIRSLHFPIREEM